MEANREYRFNLSSKYFYMNKNRKSLESQILSKLSLLLSNLKERETEIEILQNYLNLR